MNKKNDLKNGCKIIVHYASILTKDDIPAIEFIDSNELFDYLEIIGETTEQSPVVFVCAIDEVNGFASEIFITENIDTIIYNISEYPDILDNEEHCGMDNILNIYLQEYESYEDAYKIALSMKEDSPLCYNKD